MIMSSDDLDSAGLGTFLSKLFDEADLGTDVQAAEPQAQNAVPMKEDLATIERLEESVACLGEKPCHTSVRKVCVSLDEPTAAVDVLLDLPLHLLEGLLDHEREIAISGAPGGFALDHQFRPGHLEVDADLEEVALLVVTVGLVNDHVTACDPVVSVLQAVGRFLDGALDDLRMGKIVERDLEWSFHCRSLVRDDRDG